MNQPIVFDVTYEPEDALRVARFVQRQSFFYRNDALLAALFIFFGIVFLILIMSDDIGALNLVGSAVFAFLPALATGLLVHLFNKRVSSWFAKRRVAKIFRSSPTLNERTNVEISIDGIKTSSKLGSSFLKWAGIVKVTETQDEFLVYLGDGQFPGFFPKRSFEPGYLHQARKCFRQILGDRAQLLTSESDDATVE